MSSFPTGAYTFVGHARGVVVPNFGGGLGVARLDTDPIGNFTLTLTNLVVGSAVRIEITSTGVEVAFRTAASTSEVFTIPAYSSGNPANDLRIKVRKGSTAPLYKPYDTQATALISAQSIFIAQIPD
jgi:hypothetical protein